MKENLKSSKYFEFSRAIGWNLPRIASMHVSFRTIVSLICLTIVLFTLGLFNLWYPQGFEDLLINSEWRPVPNQPTQFRAIGEQGRRRMRQSSVMIVGVGKDISHRLDLFLAQVESLASYFNDSRAVFVEGDSTDGSKEILLTWAKHSPRNRSIITVTSAGDKDTIGLFKGLKLPREGRLAIARNHALNAMRKLGRTDFVIMVDMDVIGWNIFGIQDSFGRPSWDVICANGIIMHGLYRDTYAFRSKDIDTNHHKGGHDHLLYNITATKRLQNRETVRAAKQKVRGLMDTATSSDGNVVRPFEVDSCFGGLAIYRYDTMANCSYAYRETSPPHMLDCEHVLFHKCLKNQNHARIFTNPHMKLWYGHAILEKVRWSDLLPFLFPA